MAIKKPIPITFNLDSRQSVQSVCAVIHIDDNNTETLDLSLMQGGEHIAISPNSTVTARFVRVKDKILISDNVPCAVQENGNIYIPIDNAAAHMLVGEIKIEVNIVDENDVLTMQFPLVIRVNNTILADAEISPESEGTIPELLEEAREAAESATQAAEAATKAISTKQDKLTAGENITISDDNVISAEGGGVTSYNDLTDKPTIAGKSISGNINLSQGLRFYYFPNYGYRELSTDTANLLNKIVELTNDINNRSNIFGFQTRQVIKNFLPNNKRSVVFQFYTNEQYVDEQGTYRHADLQFYIDFSIETGEMFFRTVSQTNNQEVVYGDWEKINKTIVSGVVNANGTITFTDSEGNTFTTSGESVIGADGFSPSATVQQTASGATITVTDKNGITTANISNGQDGTDYVLTNADKQEIAQMAVNLLPNADMVSY